MDKRPENRSKLKVFLDSMNWSYDQVAQNTFEFVGAEKTACIRVVQDGYEFWTESEGKSKKFNFVVIKRMKGIQGYLSRHVGDLLG